MLLPSLLHQCTSKLLILLAASASPTTQWLHPSGLLQPTLPCAAECIENARKHRKKLVPIKLLPTSSLEPLAQQYGWAKVTARYGGQYACLMDPHEKLYTIMAALARGHPIACGIK